MSPFRLEPPSPRKERPEYRMLITKRTYSPNVKTGYWKNFSNSRPVDTDPFCPGKVNYFSSHYNRLGMDVENYFESTTHSMLKQLYEKDKYNDKKEKKTLINFVSYNNWLPCEIPNFVCPPGCVYDYSTTMQNSYSPPKPYTMQGLTCPVTPFLQNRKFKRENSTLSPHKYFDESFEELSHQLAQIKSFRSKSYNLCTGEYTEGAECRERSTI